MNALLVNVTASPGGSVGGIEAKLGEASGPVKFEVSEYDAGSPPVGFVSEATPATGGVPGAMSAFDPARANVSEAMAGNAGATPYCSSSGPVPAYDDQLR